MTYKVGMTRYEIEVTYKAYVLAETEEEAKKKAYQLLIPNKLWWDIMATKVLSTRKLVKAAKEGFIWKSA